MKNIFFTALICLLFMHIGCDSVPIINKFGLSVSRGSRNSLLVKGKRIAKENNLKIKLIKFDTINYPRDIAAAIIEFEVRDLGNNVFEFAHQIFTNSNWPSRLKVKETVDAYPKKLGRASTAWVEKEKVKRIKKIRMQIDGEEIFVIYYKLDANKAKKYLKLFIDWTKSNPNELKDELKKISKVVFDNRYETVIFYFDRKSGGCGYIFNVPGGKFEFVGIGSWGL